MMLISFDLVQVEDLTASRWQLLDRPAQSNTIDRPGETRIGFPNLTFEGGRIRRDRLIERKQRRGLTTTQLHQHGVYCDPVEPGRESGIASERIDAAKYLQKGFLR